MWRQTRSQRGVGFVLRRYPDHSLLDFCDEVNASLVIGDENPLREPRVWRERRQRSCASRSGRSMPT